MSLAGDNGKYGHGQINILVPPEAKKLALSVQPQKSLVAPGSDTTLNIELKNNKGQPISGGHVALAVVDEALLALKNHSWYDPLSIFYPMFYFNSREDSNRSSIFVHPVTDTKDKWQRPTISRRIENRDLNFLQVEPTVLDERHYTSGRLNRGQLAQLNSVARSPMILVANGRILGGAIGREERRQKLSPGVNFKNA